MDKHDKEILKLFQCDYNRSVEESFAQILTENDLVRLFFINEDQAYTDGKNIVVDPAINDTFADKKALAKVEDFLSIKPQFSTDSWSAIKLITRAQNIHESLHILYTNHPSEVLSDSRASTKISTKVLAMIRNIIEDAFIEAVGCSVYDNLELPLLFSRLAIFFSEKQVEGTIDRAFKSYQKKAKKTLALLQYMNYMGVFLLYPIFKLKKPACRIRKYVKKTKQLFLDGSICGDAKKRYEYTQKIFDIIKPLLPKDEELESAEFEKLIFGYKLSPYPQQIATKDASQGRRVVVTRRLFTGLDNNQLELENFDQQIQNELLAYEKDKEKTIVIVKTKATTVIWESQSFDTAKIHNNIKIIETKPKPNLNLRKAYQNYYDKYRLNINSYNKRFAQLLKARITTREDKKLFGQGIASKRLADVKKRYWYQKVSDQGIPDIAVLLLIDGSGSMAGARRSSAIVASLVLHEVLKKQEVIHAIVEHRAIYNEPKVQHNVLVDFFAKDEEKFNILALNASEGTREGLSLYWAEKYIANKTFCEENLIIVLSDGEPAHDINGDGSYLPPASIKDTAAAAKKISKRGTKIIAVALDDASADYSCYNALKKIYPTVVSCTDLAKLTGQLLTIISHFLG